MLSVSHKLSGNNEERVRRTANWGAPTENHMLRKRDGCSITFATVVTFTREIPFFVREVLCTFDPANRLLHYGITGAVGICEDNSNDSI